MLSTWAKGLGSEHSRLNQFGNAGGVPLGYGCAHAIVLSKIKEALGLDQVSLVHLYLHNGDKRYGVKGYERGGRIVSYKYGLKAIKGIILSYLIPST